MTNTEYILFADDDMTFGRQEVDQLVEDDKDIVCGLFYRRSENPVPIAYSLDSKQKMFRLTKPPKKLDTVAATSLAFTLVNMKVFEIIGSTFEFPANMGEDLLFSIKAREAGFKMWLDPKVKVGHIMERVIGRE